MDVRRGLGRAVALAALGVLASACSMRSEARPPTSEPAPFAKEAVAGTPTPDGAVETLAMPGCPLALSAGGGDAFVGLGCIHSGGHLTSETLRIPATGQEPPAKILTNAPGTAVIDGSLWAAGLVDPNGKRVLAKIDPESGNVESSVRSPHGQLLQLLAGDASGVWTIGEQGTMTSGVTWTLYEVDPGARRIVRTVALDGIEPKGASRSRFFSDLAVSGGSVWMLDLGFSRSGGFIVDGYVIRMSARRGRVTGAVSVGHTNEFAFGDGAVWTSDGTGRAIRIDAKTLKVTDLHVKNFEPFAVGEGGVWYLDRSGSGPQVAVRRIDPKSFDRTFSVVEPSFPSTVGLDPVLDETSHTVWVPSDDQNDLTRIDVEP